MNTRLTNILTQIPQIVRDVETLIPGQGQGHSKKGAVLGLVSAAATASGAAAVDPAFVGATVRAIEETVKEMNADGAKGVSETQELTITQKLDAILRDTELLIEALVHIENADVLEPHQVIPDLPPKGVPLTVKAATDWAAKYENLSVSLSANPMTGEMNHWFKQTGPGVMPGGFFSCWYPLA